MKWIKRDSSTTIEQVIERNSKLSIQELVVPKSEYYIENLELAADLVNDAIISGSPISIYGDYDADGVTASAILYMIFEELGYKNVSVHLPCRFNDGYGLSEKAVDLINEGLLITVDNGIAAVEAITAAKEKGLTVIILDHHLPREDGVLPPADVIVDPNALPNSEFNFYCGAGLAYKLACSIIDNSWFQKRISTLAAIGTVADVMPLIHDNRNIVIEGLNNMNKGIMPIGLKVLCEILGVFNFDAEDFGFKFGPIINAVGRLKINGATTAFEALTCIDYDLAHTYAQKLIEINEERKEAVSIGVDTCEQLIAEQCLFGDNPLVVYTTKEDRYQFPEGIVGILAGKLAETYKVPSIVLTETEKGFKGSGRSYGDINLKELLDKSRDHMLAYGGHAGAAGLTVSQEKIEDFKFDIQSKMEPISDIDTDVIFYDLELTSTSDIESALNELKVYAPFGEGNPRPVFKISNTTLVPKAGAFVKRMGANGQHLKMFGSNFDIVAFDSTTKYQDLGEPLTIDIIGKISENNFAGKSSVQVEALDFSRTENSVKSSPLADMIASALRSKGMNK